MGLTGDTGALQRLRERVREITSQGGRTELAQVLAAASLKLIADQFRGSYDPYGNSWARLRRRKGKPLLDTGRMRASVAAQPGPNGFRITIPVAYAAFHQDGTGPSHRAERGARQNARGRFVGSRAKTAYLLRIRAHQHPGIPRRQILPTRAAGGLGPIWSAAFARESSALLRRQLARAA